jgi:hypothetical protein
VCSAHWKATEKHEATMKRSLEFWTNREERSSMDGVAAPAYLRDRIGVPRDMTLPAARQSAINWSIEKYWTSKIIEVGLVAYQHKLYNQFI